ncbi:PAN2-PAN3 deadenylation complex catalytic subunit PAN2 [Tribolium castaneum]|uniref:PAN2-PAN3 deadenylation complex catalytic subunit PAN2 n=1 Tax=Tribolium castaneum TaxID=7070 RepID=D6WYL7_TRICA|nr:PREDICTED: PAB-dependent poly(A)-specific ribonuclease subunit PAN2 [Tribolium castaneum]EFA09006.2 PAB-dependent poly(A)-specific ribonuclease subunit PAN2-like Protein [Tribolium castaneum]|eukprot:XP_008197353.1 PREDICTED: PAB-dependent poly(A)-specific ribonuclease subunit PAN2 [Tribolium castaneum]
MFFDQSGLAVAAPPPDVPELMGIESEYVQTQCILADGGDRFGVSALAFDRYEELLWMGNQGGHVTSYYTGAMQKYTSFQIHATEDVRQVLTINEGVLGLTSSSLRYQIRRGIPVFTHTSANMYEMQCMLQVGATRLLMGGHHGKLIDFNIDLCKEMQVVDVGEPGCVMLRPHSRFVCAGNPLGRIDLRDPNTLNTEHTLETHSGSLSDFDVQGNLLVTCGFSNRHGNLTVDRFLMVYDLRMMRAVTPIQTVLDPLYLRFLPSVSSRLAVVSALGHAQILDTVAFAEPRLCLMQMDSPAMCLTFDISATSQALAFGDSTGSIHLFSSTAQPLFNSYSRMTEHGDPLVTYPSFAIDDFETPLAVIPMPICHDGLSSDWPEHLMKKCYRRPVGVDPEVLRTMKMKGPIGYAPNPRTTRRNQVMYEIDNNKARALNKHDRNAKLDDSEGFIAIPKRYRKIDVKYNKLGTDECQFDQFNKTGHTGLEATLPNAYCNAMIQVLYYIEPIRAVLLSHLCNKEFCLSCELGFLFHMLRTSSNNSPCQPANFLRAFRTIPEASALSLVYSDLPPDQKTKINLGALIQSWNRFIIHQLHVELAEAKKKNTERKNNKTPFSYNVTDFPAIDDRKKCSASEVNANMEQEKRDSESEIIQLLGAKQIQKHSCLKCKLEVKKESILLVCNLIYPTNEPERDEWSFCDILTRSLCSQQTTPAWCEECKKFAPTQQTRVLQSLPKLLAINTGLHNPQHKQFWQSQMDKVVAKVTENAAPPTAPQINSLSSSKPCRYGDHCSRPGCRFRHSFDNVPPPAPVNNPYCSNNWLPHSISIALKEGELIIEKVEDKKEVEGEERVEDELYDLTAVVCYINDPASSEKRNIVALIKVPDSYLSETTQSEHKWYLFNDFSISTVSMQEAVWFSLDWKIPCILYYSSRGILKAKSEISPPISKEVFTEDACIARSWGTSAITFTPLTDNEFPKKGDLVAMDAEFVTLNQEEAELRSDGKMSMIKPSQMSVARITCIRGSGPMEGVPFIDDYISTQEQVVDYLTKFSGIKPGDLDANFSSKHLTTLKSTYTKLRFLLDSGVIFVGHGLKNDFRVINLVVPPEQVADTVHLFHLPHHRMVSLRFLAWHFLGVKIQSETHDSVEDARAALHLYKKYKQLDAQSKVGEALAELYERGKLLNWKVPED